MIKKIIVFIKQKAIRLGIVHGIYVHMYRRKWRKKNSLNYTIPLSYPPLEIVEIGKETYGKILVLFSDQKAKLIIGNYCSIADSVTFLLSLEHPLGLVSSYPFKSMLYGKSEATSKGDIIVGDDVWIGYGAMILSGVRVGQGAVVAAGAVVTKNVPPYAVVAGVPAKIIRYRFESDIIEELVKIDWAKIEKKHIMNHLSYLYTEVTADNVQSIVNRLLV